MAGPGLGRANFQPLETLIVAAAVYWVMTLVLSFFQDRLEKRMAVGDRGSDDRVTPSGRRPAQPHHAPVRQARAR